MFNEIIKEIMKYSQTEARKNTTPHDNKICFLTKLTHQAEINYNKLKRKQKKKYIMNMQKLRSEIEKKEIKLAMIRDKFFQVYGQKGTKQYFSIIKAKAMSQMMTQYVSNTETITNHLQIAEKCQTTLENSSLNSKSHQLKL